MMKNNIYVDFHVLQTVPPSCVNRDDVGSPKTATYGGVTRSRVSSQSWKHAMRIDFLDRFEKEDLGSRTKYLKKMISDKIKALNPDADSDKLAEIVLKNSKITVGKDGKSNVLFFISDAQAKALAEVALDEPDDKNKCQSAIKNHPSIDIALFGRMVASDPNLNVDACVQVAHAISTHAVRNEYDYFTAVDDYAPEDTSGAGHLGTIEFNSATLYRYATVNVVELYENLKEKTIEAIKGFGESFLFSMPTGKQNTFANRTVPNVVYITIRKDQPVNLAAAFEKPVKTGMEGFVENSEIALIDYAKQVYEYFTEKPSYAYGVDLDGKIKEISTYASIKDVLEMMCKDVGNLLEVCDE